MSTSSIPQHVQQGILRVLRPFDIDVSIQSFSPAAGGCINSGGKLDTSLGRYFLKWNDAARYPRMFEKEAAGLTMLAERKAIRIPKVAQLGEAGRYQFLLLEYIESISKSKDYWETTGRQLARLHHHKLDAFGLDHDNYMGSLHQRNAPQPTWVEFFIEERLKVQLNLASATGMVSADTLKKFDVLFSKLPALLPEEKPALLHGDLWSGNLMVDDRGAGCLIDPAVYGGHPEVDLAMTQLFGGFDDRFLAGYQEEQRLLPGFRERFDLYNLYPLLVHVNLFGTQYLNSVNSILNHFVY